MLKVVWVLGPPTLPPKKLIVGLMVVIFCHLWVGIIQLWSIPIRSSPFICCILVFRINLAVLVMVYVVLVLIQTTSPPQMLILEQTSMMRGSSRISVIAQHSPWHYLWVGIVQLVLLVGFFVATGDGRVCVGPKTTHITSQKVDFCIDGGDCVLSKSRDYSSMSH